MKITDSIHYLGVNDYQTDLFESLYRIPNGISYNSYMISDEKTAVFDSVDAKFCDQWLTNIERTLDGRKPDYLIIQHMEPDHSAGIARFMEIYPETCVVSSAPSFTMMKQYFGNGYDNQKLIAKEGDTLALGKHTLRFFAAPMVHWPEVIVTYDEYEKVLFSADAFGKFGALGADADGPGALDADAFDAPGALDAGEDWACEARRYYFGIVGKFGVQVQGLLGKLSGLEINTICPLHGPVLSENIPYYIGLYDTWSKYEPETEGVFIAYTSVYGNTKKAALLLAEKLTAAGCPKVAISDLAREDMAECVEDAFRYSKMVLATTTYNGGVFPFMREFLEHLAEKNYQNRTVALMDNGTWNPAAAKAMKALLTNCKNITFAENEVHIRSALNEDNMHQLDALATELSGM